jgi:hypothetical protein
VIVQADGHKQSFIAAFNFKRRKASTACRTQQDHIMDHPTIYQGKDRTDLIAKGIALEEVSTTSR